MSEDREQEDFGAILAAFEAEQDVEPQAAPQPGEKVSGTIVGFGEEVAFVDLGGKSEGMVHLTELVDDEDRLKAEVGDRVEGVVGATDESGALMLRVRPGRGEAMRSELRLAYEQKLPVEGVVSEVVKGGVEVKVGGMRAFCPISQLSDRYVEDPTEFVDRRLEFRVEKYQESGRRTNVVLSRRALLEEENRRRADELRERLEVGAVFQGTVTSVTSYGAFVDLGGLEGLLHVSEMSHQRVDDPHEVLAEGQRIEVQVIRLEPGKKPGESERISLSTRVLQRDPWKELERTFPVGTELEGRVTRLEPYGAFVELVPGVEGLVHVSKLGVEEHVRHAREVLELGQQVRVEVLAVDPEKRRISLARKPGDPGAQLRDEVDRYVDTAPRSGALGSLEHAFKKSREE